MHQIAPVPRLPRIAPRPPQLRMTPMTGASISPSNVPARPASRADH